MLAALKISVDEILAISEVDGMKRELLAGEIIGLANSSSS